MPTLALFLFRFARLLFSGHATVAAENAALRLQLAAFQRQRRRPVLTSLDRLFWVGLSLLWKRWRSPLIYVRADTVVRWQRKRFREFWARLSKRNQSRRGRPVTAGEVRRLIDGMAAANPLWRAPRIHDVWLAAYCSMVWTPSSGNTLRARSALTIDGTTTPRQTEWDPSSKWIVYAQPARFLLS